MVGRAGPAGPRPARRGRPPRVADRRTRRDRALHLTRPAAGARRRCSPTSRRTPGTALDELRGVLGDPAPGRGRRRRACAPAEPGRRRRPGRAPPGPPGSEVELDGDLAARVGERAGLRRLPGRPGGADQRPPARARRGRSPSPSSPTGRGCGSGSPTPYLGARPTAAGPAAAWSGCASGSRRSAGSSTPGSRGDLFVVEADLPPGGRCDVKRPVVADDQPVICAGLRGAARRPARPRGGRHRGRRRRAGRAGASEHEPGRRAGRRADAGDGRHRGHPAITARYRAPGCSILTTFDLDDTSMTRCAPGPAASCSRTSPRTGSSRPSAWSPRGRCCSGPR